MEEKLLKLTNEKGVEIDDQVQKEIEDAIQQNGHQIQSLPLSDFQRIFWNQQVRVHTIDFYGLLLIIKKGCSFECKAQNTSTLASLVCKVVP